MAQDGAYVALIQVRAHAGHVAHVVAHVVGNGGGVPGIVLGDAGLDFAHQVGAHVGGLGVDAAAHTGEQGHEGGAHAVHHHDIAQRHRVIDAEGIAQQEEPDGDVQHAQAHHGEAHDGAGGEGHPQALVQALRGGLGPSGRWSWVAIFMPMKPASMDQIPPVIFGTRRG